MFLFLNSLFMSFVFIFHNDIWFNKMKCYKNIHTFFFLSIARLCTMLLWSDWELFPEKNRAFLFCINMAGSERWEWEEYGQMATAIKICTVWEFLEFLLASRARPSMSHGLIDKIGKWDSRLSRKFLSKKAQQSNTFYHHIWKNVQHKQKQNIRFMLQHSIHTRKKIILLRYVVVCMLYVLVACK